MASKPTVAMKTLSGKMSFVALAVVAVVAVVSLGALTMASGQQTDPLKSKFKFYKKIGGPGPDDYAELKKTQKDFDDNLCALKKNGGQFKIKFLARAHEKPKEDYEPTCPDHASIKTDNVTKSEVASSTATDASAANDPNAVHHLYSNNQADIDAVVACLKQ